MSNVRHITERKIERLTKRISFVEPALAGPDLAGAASASTNYYYFAFLRDRRLCGATFLRYCTTDVGYQENAAEICDIVRFCSAGSQLFSIFADLRYHLLRTTQNTVRRSYNIANFCHELQIPCANRKISERCSTFARSWRTKPPGKTENWAFRPTGWAHRPSTPLPPHQAADGRPSWPHLLCRSSNVDKSGGCRVSATRPAGMLLVGKQ